MGQLRIALSAATYDAQRPPEALDALDRYARTVDGARGTTVVQVKLDRARDRIRYSRAGLMPPLIVTPDGEASYLNDAGAPPLPADVEQVAHPTAEAPFPARATLVLYTDGLIERR